MVIVNIIIVPGHNLPFDIYVRTFFTGFIMILGGIMIAHAFTKGYAGVVAALASTQAIWTTILTWVLYNEVPNGMEIGGLCAGFAGALVIALGKYFFDKFKGKEIVPDEEFS